MTAFSYQLYSSRNFPPISNTLKMLADCGYAQVEGFGGLYGTLDEAKRLRSEVDAAGLTMPTAHIGLDVLESDPKSAAAIAEALGLKAAFVPYLAADQRPDDAEGWKSFGRRVAAAAKPLIDAGLLVGWHNHDFELVPLADGSVPLDLIFEGGPELKLELDVAWVVMGGGDPFGVISRHSDRIAAVHIKDIAPAGENLDQDGWADVGEGTMDWPALTVSLGKTGARYFVMEHDNPSDHRRFAERSIQSAKGFQLP